MTILGAHTLHELSDLLVNLNGFVTDMGKTYDAGWADWSNKQPAEADDWKRDWTSFMNRWTPVMSDAVSKVEDGKSSTLGWDLTTDENTYQSVLLAYKPSDGDPTSFDDLDRRLRAGKDAPPPPVYHVVPPSAPDSDLGAYKAADQGVKAVQTTVSAAKSTLMPSTKNLIIGGTIAAVVLGIIVKIAK